MDADTLSATPAAQAALQAPRAAAGANGPMERHCLRQFAIAERLAGDRAPDRELLLCACWLHDAGLYVPSRDPYVTEGARLAARAAAALHGRLRAAPRAAVAAGHGPGGRAGPASRPRRCHGRDRELRPGPPVASRTVPRHPARRVLAPARRCR